MTGGAARSFAILVAAGAALAGCGSDSTHGLQDAAVPDLSMDGAATIPDGSSGDGAADAAIPDAAVDAGRLVTVGGTISGLHGGILSLTNNGSDTVSAAADGAFTFPRPIPLGSTYGVAVSAQPATQVCTVQGGSGTAAADVSGVAVTCASGEFTVGGNVTNLVGTVTLWNNASDTATVSASGGFTFTRKLPLGLAYDVTVKSQPPSQVCSVSSGSGTIAGDVSNVAVDCAAAAGSHAVRVQTLGSVPATGVVLTDNGGDDLMVTALGTFSFATALPDGATFLVGVKTQPAGLLCGIPFGFNRGTVSAAAPPVPVVCSAGGTADPAWGTAGVVTLSGLFGNDLFADAKSVGSVIVGGRMLASYDLALTQLDVSGAVDPAFGSGGVVTTVFSPPARGYIPSRATALAPTFYTDASTWSGHFFALGSAVNLGDVAEYAAPGGAAVTGLPNGAGQTDSYAAVSAKLANTNTTEAVEFVAGAAVSGDRIVAAAILTPTGMPARFGLYAIDPSDATLAARITRLADTQVTSGWDYPGGIAVQADGKIVVAGTAVVGTHTQLVAVRYQADGSVDGSFATAGTFTAPLAPDGQGGPVVVQPDGKIVFGGCDDRAMVLVRVLPNGTPDATFGSSGVVQMDPTPGPDCISDLRIEPQVKLLLYAGTTWAGSSNGQSVFDAAVGRSYYDGSALTLPDGAGDPSFGGTGFITLPVGASPRVRAVSTTGPYEGGMAGFDTAVLITTAAVTQVVRLR